MKKLTLPVVASLLLQLFMAITAFGQSNINENHADLVFSSQLRFSVSANLYDNLRFCNTGAKILKSRPCPIGETSIVMYQHLVNGYGLNLGAGLTIAPYNYHFNFTPPGNDVYRTIGDFIDKHYEYVQQMYMFSLSLQKTIGHNTIPGQLYSFEAGLKHNVQFIFPYYFAKGWVRVFEDGTEIDIFDFELKDTGKRSIMSGFVQVGKIIQNKKGNTFHLNMVFNYSPQKLGEGKYKFHELGYDSYGTVKQNINYIGFNFAYGLTFAKRPIRKS